VLERNKFVKYNLDEQKDGKIFTVRLSKEQIEELEWCKRVLSQPKDSTAFKQVFSFGLFVLQQDITGKVLSTVFKNKHNNWRTGVVDPSDL